MRPGSQCAAGAESGPRTVSCMWFSNNTRIPGAPSLPHYMRTFNLDNQQDWSQVKNRLTPGYEGIIDFSFDWTAVCLFVVSFPWAAMLCVRLTPGEPRAQPPCTAPVEWLEGTLTVVLWEVRKENVPVEVLVTDPELRTSAGRTL